MNADASETLQEQIKFLRNLLASLQKKENFLDKLNLLNELPIVKNYLHSENPLTPFIKCLTPESEYAIKSIIALNQGAVVFNMKLAGKDRLNRLLNLLEQLLEIENFYKHAGGIIGYHLTVIELIVKKQSISSHSFEHTRYIHPEGLHLGKEEPEALKAIRWGIENLHRFAAIFPLGGAGDRLNLKDDSTGEPLPAALLPFLGRSLLEGLIRDIQGLEYLFFKFFGKKLMTPIGIMTSVEKNNHIHILNICKTSKWFGRDSESFYFFIQPVVPVITIEGNWSLSGPLTLFLKPCGHGVMWKLAEEQGVFSWMESQERNHCLIRQINNPVGGTDSTLLALLGIGFHERKSFGFASCERLLNSDEGTNVLVETERGDLYDYQLTNIEYTEFSQKGIEEISATQGSPFSIYPTNTNILFAHLPKMREIIKKICPIPGQLINMKLKVPYANPEGEQSDVFGGRLESTMQNIADFIIDSFPHRLNQEERSRLLRTYIVYNDRSKTISSTKKSYRKGEPSYSTPEQAYYDLLSNHYALLKRCRFELPQWASFEESILQGPSCIFLFHPALGPLYSIIDQKIRKGRIFPQGELQLEIAEADIENLSLKGSLLISAHFPIGSFLSADQFNSHLESRCTLLNVTISNKGINRKIEQQYWKNELQRDEAVRIILHEGAELYADRITLEGSHLFEVPPYHQLILQSDPKGQLVQTLSPIQEPSWHWKYSFDSQNAILLTKVSGGN